MNALHELLLAECGYILLAALWYAFVVYPYIIVKRWRRARRAASERASLAPIATQSTLHS